MKLQGILGAALAAMLVVGASASADEPAEPITGSHRFRVTIDGLDAGAVRTVEGMGVFLEVIDEPPTAGDRVVRKRPGRLKYSNVTLKRAFTPGSGFFRFLDGVRQGGDPDVRRDVSIAILNAAGNEVARFDYGGCFLSAYALTPLGSASPIEERATFACDFIRQS